MNQNYLNQNVYIPTTTKIVSGTGSIDLIRFELLIFLLKFML